MQESTIRVLRMYSLYPIHTNYKMYLTRILLFRQMKSGFNFHLKSDPEANVSESQYNVVV